MLIEVLSIEKFLWKIPTSELKEESDNVEETDNVLCYCGSLENNYES